MHGTVFVYFALALYVLYQHGLADSAMGQPLAGQTVLVRTWPAAVLAFGVAFVLMQVGLAGPIVAAVVLYLAITAALTGVFYGLGEVAGPRWSEPTIKRGLCIGGAVAATSWIYVVAMSLILAKVKITSTPTFVSPGEEVVIDVRRSGFLFLPRIDSVRFNAQDLGGEGTYRVKVSDGKAPRDYVGVRYTAQIVPIQRTDVAPIAIAQPR